MIDFGISAGKLAALGAACVALLVAAPLAFAVRDELRRIAKPISVVSLALLSVCLAHFVVHGSLKTNGVGKLNAKGAEFAKVAEREGCALSRPHGDEASSLVVSKAKQPTQAEFFTRAWNIRGAWEDSFWMDFADGFVFPWGTNRLNGVEVLSQGRVQSSHRDTNAIANVGVALSMVPDVSRFAYEHTPSNTYRFAWSDAAVGRVVLNAPQYETLDASIELFRNGDSVITTNNVARRVKYVNPYDLDGDGLANWLDPHPTTSDGDCFGTGMDWLNLNCGGVLSATTNAQGETVTTWDDGANPNAYYWLTFTSLADNNRITATCNGASNLGDMEIIANELQECRIPLLAGATYMIESTDGISNIMASDSRVEIYDVSDKKTKVSLPLEFSFVPPPGDEEGKSGKFTLETNPFDVGAEVVCATGGCCVVSNDIASLAWGCQGDCGCKGGNHNLLVSLTWEGYDYTTFYTLPCPCETPPEEDKPIVVEPKLNLSVPGVIFTCGNSSAEPSDLAPLELELEAGETVGGVVKLDNGLGLYTAIWTSTNKTVRVELPLLMDASTQSTTNLFVEGLMTTDDGDRETFTAQWLVDGKEQFREEKNVLVCCPNARIVNSQLYDGEDLCNPAAIVAGTNACFALDFIGDVPAAGLIKWSIADGDARFVGGNVGERVRVASDTPNQMVRLSVQIGDCVSRPIEFTARVVEPTREKLTVWIVRDDKGEHATRTPNAINNLVEGVNKIYRQIGISFYVDSINYTNCTDFLDISTRDGYACDTNKRRSLVAASQSTGGIELYFVNKIAKDIAANHNAYGIVVSSNGTAKTVAHEIGHAFGCLDVYPEEQSKAATPLSDGSVMESRLPGDWNNGTGFRYYPCYATMEYIIEQLLMCGLDIPSAIDISSGSVYGYDCNGGVGLVDLGFFNGVQRRQLNHSQ